MASTGSRASKAVADTDLSTIYLTNSVDVRFVGGLASSANARTYAGGAVDISAYGSAI